MNNLQHLLEEKQQEIEQNGDINENHNLDYGNLEDWLPMLKESKKLNDFLEKKQPTTVPKPQQQARYNNQETQPTYEPPLDNSETRIDDLYQEKLRQIREGKSIQNNSTQQNQSQLFITEQVVLNKVREVLNKEGLSKMILENVLDEMVQPYIELHIEKEVKKRVSELIPQITKAVIQQIRKRKR